MNSFEEAVLEPPIEKKTEEIVFDKTMDLAAYLKAQAEEAMSDPNMYFAGRELGHRPTEDEAMMYYSLNGGSDDFKWRNLRHRSDISEDDKIKFYFNNQN
ncbi:hypothetical protein GF382_02240 [Candidatus Falkowbacteria bacterium]|nr:hypothetical protein [Candidatus Falkowbacteria bacterium]